MSVVITRRGNVVATVAAAHYVERETQTFGGQPFVGDWLLYDKAEPTERTLVGVVSAADFTVIEVRAAADVPAEPRIPDSGMFKSPPFSPTINPTSPAYRYGDPEPVLGGTGTLGAVTTHGAGRNDDGFIPIFNAAGEALMTSSGETVKMTSGAHTYLPEIRDDGSITYDSQTDPAALAEARSHLYDDDPAMTGTRRR